MAALEDVALGYNAAKITMYSLLEKYYPNIRKSRSTLLNAFVSAVAYIYSMFQVFAKLLQDETYVSTARELESLYKLIPMVGINVSQPTTMKVETSFVPNDPAITSDTEDELYATGTDPFLDANSYNFYLRTKTHTAVRLYDFDESWRVTNSGRTIELSIAKLLGTEYFPVSAYSTDSFTIEFPYYGTVSGIIRKAMLRFDRTTMHGAVLPLDVGSDAPSDISKANCRFDQRTGYIKLTLTSTSAQNSFAASALTGQPINITFTVRSVYRKDRVRTAVECNSYAAQTGTAFHASNIWDNVSLEGQPASGSIITFTASAKTRVASFLTGVNPSSTAPYPWISGIDPTSLKIIKYSGGAEVARFDFADSEALTDVFWGEVYRASCVYSSVTYYAYLLDKALGLVIFEDIGGAAIVLSNYKMDYTATFNSKALMQQYETKQKAVNPQTDFDFDRMTYVLEDTDPILYEDLILNITDAGYTATVFEETDNISNEAGSAAKTYFEVRLQSPAKLELKFNSDIDYANITNLLITYKTVKKVTVYSAGEALSGSTPLKQRDGTAYTHLGAAVFTFDAVNASTEAGVTGIPTLEYLRDTLIKGAFTLDKYITQVNYEAAIQTYFLSLGYEALVKVFEYNDFGTLFLDWTSGNVVFFCGLVNKYPNSNLILTAPTELGVTAGGQYTRAQLASRIPGSLTDIDLTLLNRIVDDDIDDLRNAIKDDAVMTNYLLSDNTFIQMYAVFFKMKLQARTPYTYTEAENAVKAALAALFAWATVDFVKDINVSDVYRILDSLAQVDKVLLTNMSHYKNNSSTPKVQDISYKKAYGNLDIASIPMRAVASGNRLLQIYGFGSFTAVNATSKITRTVGSFVDDGFVPTDTATITGFTNAANNVVNKTIINVSATELTFAAVAFVNEGPVAAVKVRRCNAGAVVNFSDLGFATDRRITVVGFTTPANNVANARLAAVTNDELSFNTEDATIADEGRKIITIDDNAERDENPLWNFSLAATTRRIVIDILGVGDVDVEPY